MLLASAYDTSRYFKAADLQAAKKLRIKDVTEEEIGVGQRQGEETVSSGALMTRAGSVLNKTNNRTLRGAFGDNCAGWKGRVIVAYPANPRVPGPHGSGSQSAPPAAVKKAAAQAVAAQPAADPRRRPDAGLLDDELNDDLNF